MQSMNKQNAKLQEQIDSVRLHLLILRGKEDSLHMDGTFLGGKQDGKAIKLEFGKSSVRAFAHIR